MGVAKNVFLILVLGIMFPKHATSTNSALFKMRENTRLNGHVLKQFQSSSFMSCNHWCLRNSWCTSTNFRELSEVNKKGTCELNKHGYVDQNTNLDDQKGVTFSLLVKRHQPPCAAGLTGPLCQYDNCRILQFLDAKDGSALEKHVIRTIALNSEHSCRVQCYLENACVSYNFGKRVVGDEVCELNNSTDIQHPDDLKPRVNFIYRGAENSCGTTPCMNGGTCQSGFLPHGYRCLCAAGFSGLNGETDIDDCSANPCHNGGSCRDLVNGFKCDYPEGYLGTLCDTATSECNQYKILNDSDRHSDFGRGDRKCDKNLTEDWYRFSAGAGTSISTHCLPHHRCGTDLPGWMVGAHPTVNEGVVSRKVCFHGYRYCCHRHIMINVRNCSSFFVYRLKPVQVCASRYCGKS